MFIIIISTIITTELLIERTLVPNASSPLPMSFYRYLANYIVQVLAMMRP